MINMAIKRQTKKKKLRLNKPLRELYGMLEDIEDLILVEESKLERGKNITLEEYLKKREARKDDSPRLKSRGL